MSRAAHISSLACLLYEMMMLTERVVNKRETLFCTSGWLRRVELCVRMACYGSGAGRRA